MTAAQMRCHSLTKRRQIGTMSLTTHILLSPDSDSGVSNSDGVTSLSTLTFSGQLKASHYIGGFPSMVTIFVDADNDGIKDYTETNTTAAVDPVDGTFGGTLALSENVTPYKVMARAGTSDYSDATFVTVDTTAPSIATVALNQTQVLTIPIPGGRPSDHNFLAIRLCKH